MTGDTDLIVIILQIEIQGHRLDKITQVINVGRKVLNVVRRQHSTQCDLWFLGGAKEKYRKTNR